ncbi:putative BAR adaptor protein [Drechmeria coniospora]|uniref:Putative BAR adaptor protein n=1 Tax=Drechmeria coniospora TaxID=98403 RepID=A0A151GV40_DRECN|nr:putative BAR adaptor protein [Drechmeria coniospora]KYK60964.1 putative BAR adaptor protein [Drechmeria coniospora]
MSFKGFQKSLTRAPQQFRAKFNIGENTKDAVYIDAERRFQELEKETKKLHDESTKYFEAINGMLNHQIEFSKATSEIYKPISGRMSDPDSIRPEGNPEGIAACEEYEAIVKELQETLAPELEMIESRIIRPANELMDVIKVIRKTAVKREHKRLDYDRHRTTLKKFQDKKERSAKDEKAMWKAEGDAEQATQDFDYFNDLLKDELPKLFTLEREFIQPLFQSFYYMQLNIFYTLHERMQRCDIGYFDLTREIEEAFEEKRGDIQEQAEALSICRWKTTGRPRPPKYGNRPAAIESGKQPGLLSPGPNATASGRTSGSSRTSMDSADRNPPPPYSPGRKPSSPGLSMIAAAKSKPPPPKPKPKALVAAPATETVTALYDYAAQAEGDLSFRTGDVIEIIHKTQNENEWWTGRLHGKQGQFPGNYVQGN